MLVKLTALWQICSRKEETKTESHEDWESYKNTFGELFLIYKFIFRFYHVHKMDHFVGKHTQIDTD